MAKIILANAFEQKKKKPGLKFSPGLAPIDSGNWALPTKVEIPPPPPPALQDQKIVNSKLVTLEVIG